MVPGTGCVHDNWPEHSCGCDLYDPGTIGEPLAGATDGGRADVLAGLVAKLDEYIALLGEEMSEMNSIADIHGWRSRRVKQGRGLRDEIAVLRRQADNFSAGRSRSSSGGD